MLFFSLPSLLYTLISAFGAFFIFLEIRREIKMSTQTIDLQVIKKTYDLIKWYIPIINRMPKHYKFGVGDRIAGYLYDIMESLIIARYTKDKISILETLNAKLEILRYQSRLLLDFNLIEENRYIYINAQLQEIGNEIGGWLRYQKNKK